MSHDLSKTKCVAVTGASGFLGRHITERLIHDGYRVNILSRQADKANDMKSRVTKIIVADIGDRLALDELVKDADAVIHLVSNFRTASDTSESYYRVNLEGTRNIIEAASRSSVKRFIHCSTIGVHGHLNNTPGNEKSPYNPGDLYQKTKVLGERLCQEWMTKSAMEIVILRPCSLYGPGDLRMLKMFRMLAKGTFFLLGPCRENFHALYIDDAVEGFLLALEKPGIAGETFILGGPEYLPLRNYINKAAETIGVRKPWLRLPYWMFFTIAALCEAVCIPFKIEPPLHRRRVRFYRNNRAFSIDKAKRILDFYPKIDLEQGMVRTVGWYKEQGLL